MEIILSAMVSTPLMFMMTTHPMSMGFILLIQAIIISMLTGMFSNNFWYSYILILVMVGGMLVLFIYMTSIASNEKFNYSIKTTMALITTSLMALVLIKQYDFMISSAEIIKSQPLLIKNWQLSMSKFFNWPQMMLTMLMMMYLFIALLAIVKIAKSEEGALKSK
uniref:NADH-ubiquinone oxidoreductase chain 6 n=1 Tax=Trachys variolaris TaxID=2823040 RepID=A0A8A6W4I2_9COLE|nr:NADH dehydrogenase subunit 6 [Trachys variolaris]QTK22446.1 NADH dehydrogenase subunit 6 [Trachys variolaris]